jgi:UTP--glucose-1-phosphate uridylyltransferase
MSARMRPRKAVFPVAGLGAGFLPATKACPKEMLPIVDRPLIQYAVEEAAAAGIRDMIFVTGRNKRAIEDHFDKAYELEHELAARDNVEALQALQSVVPAGVTFSYVRQPNAAGLSDALLRARPLTGDEPFAVVFPDDLIDGERPALCELVDMFDQTGASVVAIESLAADGARHDGAVVVDEIDGSIRRVTTGASLAGSNLAPVGRCVFTPGVWAAIPALPGDGEPATLATLLAALILREPAYACELTGRRFDCGTKLGYLEAQLAYARKRPELWPHLRESLESMIAATVATGRGARYTRRGDETVASLG